MRSNALFLILLLSVLLKAGEERRVLDYLNQVRQHSGLIPLQENNTLNKAAASHAHYLIEHQKLGHLEDQGHKNYTGRTPADRVVYHGYFSKDVMENIAVNTKSETASVDDLLSAIYHRFVFLSFDKDQIGIGSASTGRLQSIKNAYVYNLGSSKLNALCHKAFVPSFGTLYLKEVCKNRDTLIPQSLYEKEQQQIKSRNAKIVLHPYPGQKEVITAFYNEEPDPLPDYDVSGYPVSVQFNDLHFHTIELKTFRLFNEENQEISPKRVLSYANDPHHHLKKTEFVFMPIRRLEYATTYRAEFEAVVDGELYQRSWEFTTKSFRDKLYRITEKKTRLNVEPGSTLILYFVPASPHDLLKGFRATHGLKVSLVDQNTVKVTVPKKYQNGLRLEAGRHIVLFE
ncbi:CAP domain-containing protein [Sulfurovum mangrovi]|uniref:CAP domain-containing protein n=1 Tax=Sulfurovum mangrovi TaxID=2893889 RepID=UPI001E565B1A|nr:CAP domain-containing protein [Sulfurovum mangrovi]UFH60199.1 CAP domain-containing protein [Sulfurovum mangrovi]